MPPVFNSDDGIGDALREQFWGHVNVAGRADHHGIAGDDSPFCHFDAHGLEKNLRVHGFLDKEKILGGAHTVSRLDVDK